MCVLTYSQSLTQQQLRRGESERGSRGRGRMGQHPSLAGRGSLGGRNIKRMACAVQDYDGAAAGGGVECSFLGLVPPSLLPPSFLLRLLRDFTYAGSDAPSPPTPSSEFKLQASRLSFAGAAPTAPWRRGEKTYARLLLESRSDSVSQGGQGYFQTRRVRLPRPADSWRGFGSGSRFDSRRRKEVLRAGPGSGARRRVCDTAVPSMSVLPRGACGTGAGVRTSPTPSPPSRDAEVDLHACCD